MIPHERDHQECREPLGLQDRLCLLWVPEGQAGLVVPAGCIRENQNLRMRTLGDLARLGVLGGQGDLGLPWGLGVQVGLEGPRRRSLSWSGMILVVLEGLANLLLLGLGVLGGLGWLVLVDHVVLVGRGDLVNQDPGLRGPRRWSCHCSRTIHQQVLAPLVGLAVLGDQLGQQGLGHPEGLGVPWIPAVLEGLRR